MVRCTAFAAAAWVGMAVPGFPQDETQLARALAQRGWFDLAEELCDRLEKGPSRCVAAFIRAEIRLGQADRETEYGKAAAALAEAVTLFRQFINANPTHPLALDARTSVGWIQARKGRLAMDSVEFEDDPVRQADLQKQAGQAYAEAEKSIRETLDKLRAAKGDRAQDALMDARLELPRVLMDHAKVPRLDPAMRKNMLTEARALLLDFEFDFGDRPIAFEAMLEGGKCLTELGEYKQAESKLRGTFALRKRLAEAKIKPNDYHNRIIFGAYIALAQTLQRAGRLSEARSFVDTVLKEDKTLEKEWAGPALRLEKADILFKMRDVSGALALATEIINKDPNGRWGFVARDKMKKWGESGASIRFTPAQMMTAADSSMDRELFRDALRDFRRCIEACSSEADRQKYEAAAYFKMGQCFQALQRNYEAAFAYEKLFTRFPKDPNAPKACYEAVRCYNAEFSLSGD